MPGQTKQLLSWSEQRDSALREVSVLEDKKLTLSKEVEGLSDTKTKIKDDVVGLKGRLNELNEREKEYEVIVSKEVAELEVKKTALELRKSNLEEKISRLEERKEDLARSIELLVSVKEKVSDHVNSIESVMKTASDAFSANSDSMIRLVAQLSESVEKILEINNGNVKKTLEVIEDLPRIYVELRKKTIERTPIN